MNNLTMVSDPSSSVLGEAGSAPSAQLLNWLLVKLSEAARVKGSLDPEAKSVLKQFMRMPNGTDIVKKVGKRYQPQY